MVLVKYDRLAWMAIAGACLLPVTTPALAASHAQQADGLRTVVELGEGWRFRKGDIPAQSPEFDDRDWATVTVPHTWNRIGEYDASAHVPGSSGRKIDKYMGVAWYRLSFVSPAVGPTKRVWLEFDAASRTAEVWLNGKRLGAHAGGFSRFRFDATDAIRKGGRNFLAVRVDNSEPQPGNATANTLPLAGDFFVQGGLYRPVRLIVADATHFAMDDFGGPGIYARTQSIASGAATVSVESKLSTERSGPVQGSVVTRLVAADGTIVARSVSPFHLQSGAKVEVSQELTVPDAHLWQGTADPYLYSLESELRDGNGRLLDRAKQSFGIRQFRIDPEKGFFINGQHVALHGVGLHQDGMESGWAMTKSQIADRFETVRDMGANTIRLTHYQHGQPIHDLADKYGLVLWDEIALVTAWTLDQAQGDAPPEIMAQARQQLVELIRQNYNHPSVALWGIANEVDFGPMRPDFLGRGLKVSPSDPTPMLEELAAIVRREDPDRSAALATCCEDRDMPDVPTVANAVPVSGGNRYFGWYYGKPEEVGPHFDALHAKRPSQPQAITEYGAGGALSIHTDNPLGGPFDMGGHDQPEEYQSWLHEKTWPYLEERPFLFASWLWNAFDFATVTRTEGDAKDINTKGLVSYDGRIRKDAFYYYRAHWSDQPTVHVNGRRYVQRAYPTTDISVYSNAPRTKLFLNGKDLGEQGKCDNLVCVWSGVQLSAGANTVEAVGSFADRDVRDAVSWNLDASRASAYYIDSGALVAAPGYGSDTFFHGGRAGSTDQHPRGRPPVLAPIVPDEEHAQLATFREGTFSYRLPVEPGRYSITLRFLEPKATAGERVFDVKANGKTVIAALDVAKEAGAPITLVARTVTLDVTENAIDLQFLPRKGDAIVSTIEVRPSA